MIEAQMSTADGCRQGRRLQTMLEAGDDIDRADQRAPMP